jgi:hypothetical protein
MILHPFAVPIDPPWSLAFFGSDSARKVEARRAVRTESLSKRRLEGSGWRGVTSMEVQRSFGTVSERETGFCVRGNVP